MRTLKLLPVILLVVFSAGCWTLSLHPLYFPEDVTFEPALIGSWGDPDDKDGEIWRFEESTENTYCLIMEYREEGSSITSTSSFDVHLVRLGDDLFFDFYPAELESGNDFYKSHMIPAPMRCHPHRYAACLFDV